MRRMLMLVMLIVLRCGCAVTIITFAALCIVVIQKRIVLWRVLLPGIFKLGEIRRSRKIVRRVRVNGDRGIGRYVGRGSKCVPNWSQCAAGLCKHHAETEKCTLDRLLSELSIGSVHFSYNATFLVFRYSRVILLDDEYRNKKFALR